MEELEIKEKIEELEKDHEGSHPPSSRWRSLTPMTTLITDCRTAIELKRLTNMTMGTFDNVAVIEARLTTKRLPSTY